MFGRPAIKAVGASLASAPARHTPQQVRFARMTTDAPDEPGLSFQRRVAEAYEGLGYATEQNVEIAGQQIDIIVQRADEAAPPTVLAIECKDYRARVSNQEVQNFVATVTALRAASRVDAGVLVTANGFTAPARAVVESIQYVRLMTWQELLSAVLDVRTQIRKFVARYDASPIASQYLELELEELDWPALMPRRLGRDVLSTWPPTESDERRANALVVLADFGAGKTTLLRRLQYRSARAYLSGTDLRVPLFVPLRNYRDSRDVEALLRRSYREAYLRDLSPEILWDRLKGGRFHVLLDGFDEMLDRSDAARRLDAFYELLGIFNSSSPSVLTSRPSFFVEPDELTDMLERLQAHETELRDPRPTGRSPAGSVERIRRRLVSRHREVHADSAAMEPPTPRTVVVGRLNHLSPEQVEAFVHARAGALAGVGATPSGVLHFIAKTYDLSDLANRPMLLDLIVDSVVDGGLDVAQTDRQLGPSGLYEIYTNAKLDLDIAKGRVRQAGLSLDQRRHLAELLAWRMYGAHTLEMPFAQVLGDMVDEKGDLPASVGGTALSPAELATDFATCSFITLDADGVCRFIHKSFRGFFVARVLKERLRSTEALLREHLEREVLYFLGGFTPTQPFVGEALWKLYKQSTAGEDATFRRNVVVAWLYSSPEHRAHQLKDVLISDANFSRLAFSGTDMRRVSWDKCELAELCATEARWRDVAFSETPMASLTLERGTYDVRIARCAGEALRYGPGAEGTLQLEDAMFDQVDMVDARATLHVTGGRFRSWNVEASAIGVRRAGGDSEALVVGRCRIDGSLMDVRGVKFEELVVASSVVVLQATEWQNGRLRVRESIVVAEDTAHDALESDALIRQVASDVESVLCVRAGISMKMLRRETRCGVFGYIRGVATAAELACDTEAWGVVALSNRVPIRPTGQHAGWRAGRLLIASAEWFEDACRPDGMLSALDDLKAENRTSQGAAYLDVLARLKKQYEKIARESLWQDAETPTQ
jgi:hypothetical protein